MDTPRFRINDHLDVWGDRRHGKWHPDKNIRLRAIELTGETLGEHLSGYVTAETFNWLMRTLVSSDYGTPNWCEKCHIAGHGYCRCEIACNE